MPSLETLFSPGDDGPARVGSSRVIELILIAGFWILIFVITVGPQVLDPRRAPGITRWILLHWLLEYLLWIVLTPTVFTWARRFNLERSDRLRVAVAHVGAALTVAVAAQYYGYLTWGLLQPQPLPPEWGYPDFFRMATASIDELLIYGAILTAGFGRDYYFRYRNRRKQAADLETQLAEARLEALRMQINPHFLFNTLNAVATLVTRNPAAVKQMVGRLSSLLRYVLESDDAQETSLREELKVLEDYLEIQRIRFEDRLQIGMEIEPGVGSALVPFLLLQPLVENAVKHGAKRASGVGRVEIRVYRDEGDLVIEVLDDGPGLPADYAQQEGVGLKNTRRRLRNLYGEDHEFAVENRDGETGVRAWIRLPYHREPVEPRESAGLSLK